MQMVAWSLSPPGDCWVVIGAFYSPMTTLESGGLVPGGLEPEPIGCALTVARKKARDH